MEAVFIRMTESGKSALCTVKANPFALGGTPVYLAAAPFAECTKGDGVEIPDGFTFVPLLDKDGEALTTKDGSTRQTLQWAS